MNGIHQWNNGGIGGIMMESIWIMNGISHKNHGIMMVFSSYRLLISHQSWYHPRFFLLRIASRLGQIRVLQPFQPFRPFPPFQAPRPFQISRELGVLWQSRHGGTPEATQNGPKTAVPDVGLSDDPRRQRLLRWESLLGIGVLGGWCHRV